MAFQNKDVEQQIAQSAALPPAPPPVRPSEAAPGDAPEPHPDATWTTEALLAYAMAFLAEAGVLARKTTVVVLRAGLAFWILRERLRAERTWCQFQRERNLPRTSVWEAIELHLRVAEEGLSEDEVAEMPWPEARERFGLGKPRKDEADDQCGPVPAHAVDANPAPEAGAVSRDPALVELGTGKDAEARPAEPAVPAEKVKKAEKKDHGDLSPCEIDAATEFVKKVGSWGRAIHVMQAVKDIIGG